MFDYHLYYYDEEFDYLSDELPGELHYRLGDQLERARDILTGRSRKEIDYAIGSLDWMLRRGGERLAERAMKDANGRGHCFVNRVKAFKELVADFDLSDQSDFPKATWAEYFAVLTIAYILEVLHEANSATAGKLTAAGFMDEEQRARFPVGFMMDAMMESADAITYAECLMEKHLARRERGRKGNEIRNSDFNGLYRKVAGVYWANEHYQRLSNREAARRLLDQFQAEAKQVLRTDDPLKRFEKWVARILEEGPPGSEGAP